MIHYLIGLSESSLKTKRNLGFLGCGIDDLISSKIGLASNSVDSRSLVHYLKSNAILVSELHNENLEIHLRLLVILSLFERIFSKNRKVENAY